MAEGFIVGQNGMSARIAMKKGASRLPFLSAAGLLFLNAMLPFTLLALMSRPPLPMVPDAWRGPHRPESVSEVAVDPAVHGVERNFPAKPAGT